jgi:hypothetical protein
MNKKATFQFRNKTYTVEETEYVKKTYGPGYRVIFDKKSGYTERWGDRRKDDPDMAPFPEIMDLEIATGCDGIGKGACKFCYKSNTPQQHHEMSIEDVEKILHNMGFWCYADHRGYDFVSPLQQVAFGITRNTNQNLLPIFKLTRELGIIPNVTTHGYQLTEDQIKEWGKVLGAVAVSRYDNQLCFDTVEAFTRLTNLQVNIHQLLSEDTYDDCMRLLELRKSDPRLAKMNAIVFLMLKPKGRGSALSQLKSMDKYKALIGRALVEGIPFGFDSCSATVFEQAVSHLPNAKQLIRCSDPCESGLFSIYANDKGDVSPCSFTEQELAWWTPPNLITTKDFMSEVWDHPRMNVWRNNLLANNRNCPAYDLSLD